MSKITVTTTIDAPRSAVWALLTDVERMPEYALLTEAVEDVSPTPVEVGTTWRESGGVGPIDTSAEWEVTALESPRRFQFAGDAGVAEATVTVYLSAVDDDRTRLKEVINYELLPERGILAEFLDWAVVHRILGREAVASVEAFRSLAEREAADLPGSTVVADREIAAGEKAEGEEGNTASEADTD